ncbi:hypothetical protein G4B88_008139 [Cannabis sativa]|uniref:RNase H type-1 domain-containing protein n=1 Tax=Cannabis sativa TaxID=3483 RepID=A0A7J6I7F1_CANSA|nr:hypothetical protein G4B88_008139 [Cannabis sativa]
MNHILSSDYVWSSLLKDICSSNLLLEASYRLCSSSTLVRVTVFFLLSLRLNQTVSLSIEEMAQTLVPSSRRPFSSRYSILWLFYLIVYLYVYSLRLSLSPSLSSSTPAFFLSPPTMASSSNNPNPITALDDEDNLVHDFDHISIHSPTDANSFCLFFKLLSPKSAKPSWIEKAMSEAWTLRFPCQISEYHSGLFLASFQCDGDRLRVLKEQPWHFDKFLMFFPRIHPRPDAQDLQQAVDQFLHVDSPHSSPNSLHAHVSVQFPHPVLSTSPLPVSHSNSGPVMPPISTSIPVPIMTDSVSTHTAKGKGKAIAISTPSHPSLSRGGKGVVINEPCPLLSLPLPLLPGRPSREYIAAQGNYQGDELDSEAVPISHTTQQQHSATLHLDTPSLFVDAALDHKNGLTGTGFIFKLGYQTVLASHCRPLPGAVSPIFAEGQALLQSLRWCLDSQLSPKFVFSDCLNLVSKVNSDWQDNSALSGLVSRIRLLFSNFPDASLHFLPRQLNMDAHGLAKEALRPREDS